MTRRRIAAVGALCLATLVGPSSAPTSPFPTRIVHGQTAGPLDAGAVTGAYFSITVGKPFEFGQIFLHNTSRDPVRIRAVRPDGLTSGIRLLALRAWLVPRHTRLLLPGAWREWPLKDPRARAAVPARDFSIPAGRAVQIILGVRMREVGVQRLEGARVTFVAGGLSYDWTLRTFFVAKVKPARP